jgi:hypothetical protein
MTMAYSTQRDLLRGGVIRRISQMTSYTTPPTVPLTFILNPSGNFTTTGTFKWKKTPGGNPAWDSNVFGQQGFTSGTMTCQALDNTKNVMIGVSTNNTTIGFNNIDFGITTKPNGLAQVYNGGAAGSEIGAYTAATVFKMTWTTSTIIYYMDNVQKASFARPNANALYVNWCYNYINSEAVLLTMG